MKVGLDIPVENLSVSDGCPTGCPECLGPANRNCKSSGFY